MQSRRVEIRLLGPVAVFVDGESRPVPGGGERELLAVLALSAGHVVPAHALVSALWGEDLPVNPDNALQVRVSKLRRALAAVGVGAELVATRRPGYVLDLDPAQVDALRFARTVTAARGTTAADPAAAARIYREALATWGGGVLEEFAESTWAGPEITRLEELRLAAREELVDLELASGRHADVLAELEALAAEHPLREKLQGRLMLALYRAGRQADALAVYQRTRTLLDEELGLAPSTDLRNLHAAILQQRPDLRGPDRTPPPAPAPVRTTPTAAAPSPLPLRLTSFLGRDDDVQRVLGLLADHRLVTVVGPGGVGKTSLALEAARGATDRHPDGVAFARLAGVTDPQQLPHAVLTALGVGDVPTATPDAQLMGHLRTRDLLVVLDNCEHLADACAVLVEHLLESCPDLRVLTTSREPLAARGEVLWALDPLDVPAPGADLDEVVNATAVRLFVERARSAVPGFSPDDDELAALARICRSLDGIPLAIELAAARVPALSVRDVEERMADRFTLLTGGPRTAEARQRTLRATVDWSHGLLTEPERRLLRRLSVFRGTWTLAAAQAVGSGEGLEAPAVVDTLTRLVDRSLVVVDRGPGARYHLLETVREYARERLAEAGEAESTGWAHVRWITALAEQAEEELRGDGQLRWLARMTLERDDVEAALVWCTARADEDPDAGLRLVGALGWYWYFASRPDGGAKVAAMLRAAPGGSDRARALGLLGLAVAARPGACIVHPAAECAAAAAESRRLFLREDDPFRAALAATLLAVEWIGRDDQGEGLALLRDAELEFQRLDATWCSALVHFVRMELHAVAGDIPAATAAADLALDVFRALGDRWGVSAIQFHLGMALHRSAHLEDALAMYQGALVSGREVGSPVNTIQYALAGAGHVALQLGDLETAQRSFAESHAVSRQLGAHGNARAAVGNGLLARARGDLEQARAGLGWAQQMLAVLNEPEWSAVALVGLGQVAEADGDVDGAAAFHRQAWHTVPGHAPALEGLACVAAARGDGSTAARLLGAAQWWRERRHRPALPTERADVDRARRRAQELLGADGYQHEFGRGLGDPRAVVGALEAVPA